MRSLSVVIVDDERSARELIRELLSDVKWVSILGEAGNVDDALALVSRTQPDVILLDIQMPGQDGFALIEQLVHHDFETGVIFVTAYERYAIRAIRASAFDYLLKPVKKSDLITSLEKYEVKVSGRELEEPFSRLIWQFGDSKKLKFRNRTGFSMIDPDEILYCQADSNYTVLELKSGRKLTISMNLGKVEEMLPEVFVRISRSVIINLQYLTQVDRKSLSCTLMHSTPTVLKVSRNYLRMLEDRCEQYFSIQNRRS